MKNIIIAIIFGITFTQSAFSGGSEGENCPVESSGADCHPDIKQNDTEVSLNCIETTVTCYTNPQGKTVGIYSCKRCSSSNGKLTSTTTTISGCDKTVSYQTCTACSSCSNCTSDSGFVSAGAGYEKKTTATCDCGTCITKTEYRCAAGYYGSSTNGSSGCIRCPESGNSSAGSSNITDCYISGNFTDSTGSGTYTGSCYYK